MAREIDESQIRQAAQLARLELNEQEIALFSRQLSAIVQSIEKLNELDTKNVEPLIHFLPVYNVFREDRVRPSLTNEQALANAPDHADGYFKVPKILEENSSA